MARLVLHEVRYVLMAMVYSSRCLAVKIQNSAVDKSVYWFLTLIPIATLCIPQFTYLLVDTNNLFEFVSVLVPFTEILLTNLKMVICNAKRAKIINLINEIQAEWIEFYLLALTLSGFDSLFSTLAMHITTMFKFLKIEIDQLGLALHAGAKRSEIHAKLKHIILKHKTNLSLIEQLEDGFSFYLMVQFLTSSIIVCVVLYELTMVFGWNEDTFKTLTYLPGAILQLYLFCWYAQNITEEASLVSDHIYNIPWYLSDPALQKTILTLMVKAQKPTGVTASKFYMVTLQSFQRITSTSYSYFTLLQTINQQ
uniref:Odorant receptor n=1 Tax=Anopheles culicifacies TaxID=139723 RepID=A0A182M592_9DIPT